MVTSDGVDKDGGKGGHKDGSNYNDHRSSMGT